MQNITPAQKCYLDNVVTHLSCYHAESVGVCDSCDECRGKTDEGHFSWHACEFCGSRLGGDRYAAHALDSNNELLHFEVCVDCLMYFANGELPECEEQP